MYASHILNIAHEVFTITVAGLFITIVEAVAYVMSGMYGDPKEIGYFFCSVIVLQLFIAGIICILLVCQLAQTGTIEYRCKEQMMMRKQTPNRALMKWKPPPLTALGPPFFPSPTSVRVLGWNRFLASGGTNMAKNGHLGGGAGC